MSYADPNIDPGWIFAEPSAFADPQKWHEAARVLRDTDPIHFTDLPEFPDFYAITRHADVMEIERNADVFTNAPVPALSRGPKVVEDREEPPMKTLVQLDGDEHRVQRNVVNDWFKPGNVRELTDRVKGLATEYVDRMATAGSECDFNQTVALHYPLHVILEILGLPESDYPRMLQLTQELFGGEDPDIARIGEDEGMMMVMLDFVNYFNEIAADKRANPTGDLASVVANGEIDGQPIDDMNVLGHYLVIATAGHDTTSNSISGGMLALLEHPEQMQEMRDDPSLIDSACDELIRYVTPVKHFTRTCQSPFTVGGHEFQPGDLVLLSYASANRDENVFENPMAFDIHRANADRHLAFGFGRHFCLGAHLARLEIRSIFHEILNRVSSIELAGQPQFFESNLVSGPKVLPISYSMA